MAIILRTILSSKWCVFCHPDHRLQPSPSYLWLPAPSDTVRSYCLLTYANCITILIVMLYCEHKNKEMIFMANTAAVYARIDPKLKADVEDILSQLGLTPSSVV